MKKVILSLSALYLLSNATTINNVTISSSDDSINVTKSGYNYLNFDLTTKGGTGGSSVLYNGTEVKSLLQGTNSLMTMDKSTGALTIGSSYAVNYGSKQVNSLVGSSYLGMSLDANGVLTLSPNYFVNYNAKPISSIVAGNNTALSLESGALTITSTASGGSSVVYNGATVNSLVQGANMGLGIDKSGNLTLNSTYSVNYNAKQINNLLAGNNTALSLDESGNLTINSTASAGNSVLFNGSIVNSLAQGSNTNMSYESKAGVLTISSTASGGSSVLYGGKVVNSIVQGSNATFNFESTTGALTINANSNESEVIALNTQVTSLNAKLVVVNSRLDAIESQLQPTPVVESVLFSPYKDVGINAFWGNTNMGTMGTTVLDNTATTPSLLLSTVPSDVNTVTWAFASNTCTAESWGSFSRANVLLNKPLFVSANKNYIISTGGLAGAFTCDTDANLVSFVDAYYSANMVGLDFDIENTLTTVQIASLTSGIKAVQAKYPSLRISYTVATLAGSDGSGLIVGSSGEQAILSAQTAGIKFNVNLMVMDYGTASSVCVIDSGSGYCDMNLSAQQATKNLNAKYSIAYSNIELTPMIGLNDVNTNDTSLANVSDLATWVKSNGLAGMHIWSYDRDASCKTNWAVNAVPTICSGAIESVPFQTTSLQYQETIVNKLK